MPESLECRDLRQEEKECRNRHGRLCRTQTTLIPTAPILRERERERKRERERERERETERALADYPS